MSLILLKGSSKKGADILSRADNNIGTELLDAYHSVSEDKHRAYASCYSRYCDDNASFNFHICSKNTFQFTVAWNYINELTGELMTHFETANHIYIVDGSR